MRVVIAGAGGRMGRTLISAIAATKGLTLAGAVDAPGSAVIGRDAGELAGLGPNGIKVTSDVAALLKACRRVDRVHHSGGDAGLRRNDRGGRPRSCHRHHRPFGRRGSRHRQGGEPRHHRQVRQYESRRQSARRSGQARGEDAQRRLRHRNLRDAPQQEDRRAVRHRADARPRRRRRPRHRSDQAFGARPRRHDRRAQARAISALPRCAAAPWSASTR